MSHPKDQFAVQFAQLQTQTDTGMGDERPADAEPASPTVEAEQRDLTEGVEQPETMEETSSDNADPSEESSEMPSREPTPLMAVRSAFPLSPPR